MRIKLLVFTVLFSVVGWGQVAQFDFPSISSLTVTAKDANVSVSDVALSTGTIETNITTGAYFPNEPYVEENGGWNAGTQSTAKNYYFTITATPGYEFTITNIAFKAYATSAGPSAIGFAIGSTNVFSADTLDGGLMTINQAVTGQTNLSSITIKIQGWLNGSRTSTGGGALKLDDIVVSGSVNSVSQPSINIIPTTLSGLTYEFGTGPSAEQTFSISGTNLLANLNLTAPTNYEISTTSGSDFGSSISLSPTLGTVSSTTIYVRLKAGLSIGSYNSENIVCSSSGATNQNVSCNGSVTSCYMATFDTATKAAYPEDTEIIGGKSWILGECLIGGDVGNDYFVGTKSARLRANANALIELSNSLTTGLSTVNFSYRAYQNSTGYDAITAIFSVDYSKDNGNSWIEIGTITPSSTVQTFSATVNQSGNVKFRIKYKSGNTNDTHRVNIDNIELCSYSNTQEIEVFGNSTSILDGSTSTKLSNDTDFGDTYFVGDAPIIKMYTITNYGTGTLNLSGLSISGSSDFTISTLSSNSLSAGDSATFTVTFSSLSSGLKTSEISITNNDSDESPFTFTVSCFSNNYTKCALQTMSIIASQDFEGLGSLAYVSSGGSSTTAGGQNYGDNRATKTNMFIGTTSYQVTGSSSNVLEFNNVDVSNYENLQFSFRIGTYAATTSQGMETSDKVLVSISEDGGTTWKEQLILRGNNNSISDINTSTGSAVSVVYDNTLVAGKAYGMNDNSTNTYSNSFTITGLPTVSQLKIKFLFLFSETGGANEIWAIDEVKIQGQLPQSTTWDGDAWSSGVPTISTKAIFEGDYNTTIADVQACECEIKSTSNVIVSSNDYLEVQSDILNDGTLTIEDDGSLIQVNDNAINSGTGTNTMYRNPENIKLFDYVYWSSPQSATPFSQVPNSRFYEWDPNVENVPASSYGYGNWVTPAGSNMTVGKGYIFRVPSTLNQNVTFTGSNFNNGEIFTPLEKGPYVGTPYVGANATITTTDDNWNLVGNPYPSAIDAVEFANDNIDVLENAEVSMWRHITEISSTIPSPYYQSFVYNYNGDDYVTYTESGTVPPNSFNGKIASGQGFFVNMKDDVSVSSGSNVVFNNSQRSRSHNNSEFFKTTNSKVKTTPEKHRIWLDLVNSSKVATSQMVGYIEGATNNDDFLYEAKSSLQSGFQFYSLIENKFFKIQGRQLPFDVNDRVSLGVIVPADGKYTIAINTVDGLFEETNNKIYIEDKLLGTVHDLKSAPYQFEISKGNHIERFLLRYTNQLLSNDGFDDLENGVKILSSENTLNIISINQPIKEYEIYNVLGQKLAQGKNIFETKVVENSILKTNQVLIAKIILEDGKIISKKTLF